MAAPRALGPKENQNALKHGTYTKVAFQQRKQMRGLFEEARKLICDPGASND